MVPVGAGAPPNHHAGETEAFFVLEGQVGFMIDGQERLAGPGDFVPIPDGAVHAFKAVGEAPARMLILNAPGRMHQQFFTGIRPGAARGFQRPADPERARHPRRPGHRGSGGHDDPAPELRGRA
ncbi:cupin domain-containing protein [Paracoccus sp. FO-3]|uniref:cupin domain-containing protein n=1 Tax=Paracoccus sp. FO-3 TaxID=1335059 RepID=UPI002104B955|nr:cupin domain-containing protein [Paracoccus sp. FO-3]